jgi:hypothetical protein
MANISWVERSLAHALEHELEKWKPFLRNEECPTGLLEQAVDPFEAVMG